MVPSNIRIVVMIAEIRFCILFWKCLSLNLARWHLFYCLDETVYSVRCFFLFHNFALWRSLLFGFLGFVLVGNWGGEILVLVGRFEIICTLLLPVCNWSFGQVKPFLHCHVSQCGCCRLSWCYHTYDKQWSFVMVNQNNLCSFIRRNQVILRAS